MIINKKMTTRQMTEAALAKREGDIGALKAKSRNALAMFQTMKDQLDKSTAGLEEIVIDLNDQIEALTAQKEAAEKLIADNNTIRQKIVDIIGE